ncbi:hypothetical protein GWI33_013653 [Rhynchophorus ferrugineus]|uniref:Sex-determining region Y protein n=1 Tax=Rhynchophorus ferrugineus TaxID=354439 RepID=A0A834M9R7_RHYFE|nr:hypothetical protein GWI33_013653 [Rhynchophorus ferrugineus]
MEFLDPGCSKIPRPPNAFMLYANEHRKFMAHLYPTDSNKEISRKLGQTWKDLNVQEKNKYFQRAKDIDMEHKKKYPGPHAKRPGFSNVLLSKSSPMWNGASSWDPKVNMIPTNSFVEHTKTNGEVISSRLMCHNIDTDSTLDNNSEEEKLLFEKEKSQLLAAENYAKLEHLDVNGSKSYIPISATKFVKNPELFTNNVEYHKEYIVKYFNHIPDYEIFQITMDDGTNFPYVTIPNLIVRSNYNPIRY